MTKTCLIAAWATVVACGGGAPIATSPHDLATGAPTDLSADASSPVGTQDLGTGPGPDGAIATSNDGGAVPAGLGWHDLPNTQLAQVCPSATDYPDIQGNSGCSAVIAAWAGGIADTKRNRLIVWGGGHHDYFGNEVYALDLTSGEMQRLNEPSSVAGVDFSSGQESYPDGKASARHTYGGLAYHASSDAMYIYGGGIPGPGDLSQATWTLSMSSLAWTRKDPTTGGPPDPQFGELADYDPTSDSILLWDSFQSAEGHLWRYTVATNTYALLATDTDNAYVDGYQSGAIDVGRRLFIAAGNGKLLVRNIDSGYTITDRAGSASGCSAFVANSNPGLAYDSKQKLMVAWSGGNSVSLYDPDTNTCTTTSYSGGPGSQQPNGTYGRFRYFPALNLFALVNDWQEDAYVLRLTE